MHICLWPNWFWKDIYDGMFPLLCFNNTASSFELPLMRSVTLFPLRLVLMVLLRRTGELIIEHSMTFSKSLKIEVVPFPMKLVRKWLKFIMNK